MLKILIAFTCSISSLIVYAEPNQLTIPKSYIDGKGLLPNGNFYMLKNDGKGSITFLLGFIPTEDKEFTVSNWVTKCFKSEFKGIPTTACLVQYIDLDKHQKPFSILIDKNITTILFNPDFPTETTEVNYKVDKNPIVSLTAPSYVLNMQAQMKLLSSLLIGEKFIFSYKTKTNNNYKHVNIDLLGLRDNVNFATKIINVND